MPTINPQSTTGAVLGLTLTAASITAGGWVASKSVQSLFDTEIRDLPDESLTTQTFAISITILAFSVSLGVGGRMFGLLVR